MILIQSCKKNIWKFEKIKETWGKHIGMQIIFLIGDPDLTHEYIFNDEFLTVQCEDDYDNLTRKMNIGIKAVYEKFNPTFLIKIDDDIVINCKKFKEELKKCENHAEYGGIVNIVKKGTIQNYKLYKFTNQKSDPMEQDAIYCSGGVIYFGKNAIMEIANATIKYYTKYDDTNIGIFLKERGIKAIFMEKIAYTEDYKDFLNEKYSCFHDDDKIMYQNIKS
jgi:hypothetical protein